MLLGSYGSICLSVCQLVQGISHPAFESQRLRMAASCTFVCFQHLPQDVRGCDLSFFSSFRLTPDKTPLCNWILDLQSSFPPPLLSITGTCTSTRAPVMRCPLLQVYNHKEDPAVAVWSVAIILFICAVTPMVITRFYPQFSV